MENCLIRNERLEDFRTVEELIRRAFWNVHIPGCNEHYLAHVVREHEDFIKELDLVLEVDNRIIGSVMYTKSWLVNENGDEKEILTFGPIAIEPEMQRRGYGKTLLNASFKKAVELGYDGIVIFGNPENYICNGFKSCKKFNISLGDNYYPTAMLAKELIPGAFSGSKWIYRESKAFEIDDNEAIKFDEQFEPREKAYAPSQELFYIYCNSSLS